MATFYDVCNEIWGGCPATRSLQLGVDAGDFKVLNVTACDPRSVNSPSEAHVPDLNNPDKTEKIHLSSRFSKTPPIHAFNVNGYRISPSHSVRSLGVTLDRHLQMLSLIHI